MEFEKKMQQTRRNIQKILIQIICHVHLHVLHYLVHHMISLSRRNLHISLSCLCGSGLLVAKRTFHDLHAFLGIALVQIANCHIYAMRAKQIRGGAHLVLICLWMREIAKNSICVNERVNPVNPVNARLCKEIDEANTVSSSLNFRSKSARISASGS